MAMQHVGKSATGGDIYKVSKGYKIERNGRGYWVVLDDGEKAGPFDSKAEAIATAKYVYGEKGEPSKSKAVDSKGKEIKVGDTAVMVAGGPGPSVSGKVVSVELDRVGIKYSDGSTEYQWAKWVQVK